MTGKNTVKKNPSRYWVLFLIVLGALLLITGRASFVMTFSLIFLSVLVSLYRYVIPFDIGLELVTFTTVVLSIGVSPVVGWVSAVIIIVASHIATQNICLFIPIKIVVYGAIAFLAYFIGGMGIATAGLVLTLIKILALAMVTFILNPGRVVSDIPSNILNLLINMYIFSMFGGFVLGVLA